MLRPTTIISLDPSAAALCEEVRLGLEENLGHRGRLIQILSLVRNGEVLRLQAEPAEVADPSFDLQIDREKDQRLRAEEARSLIEREVSKLESPLARIIEAGRSQQEREALELDGIHLARNRMIYLVLSAADTEAGGMFLELAKFIRWLFEKQFPEEICVLQALILLPDLFLHPESADYATTYSLLMRLDHSMSTAPAINPLNNNPPFEGCWIIGGTNARGDRVGTLSEQLESYRDSLVGFLTSEPERSGPRPGEQRGRPAAYSSFGYAEIYYPAATMVRRLSSALARDIIKHAFLADATESDDNVRRLLFAARDYVSSADYTSEIDGLERNDQGGPIWPSSSIQVELGREGEVRNYISELQRRHETFKQKSLPSYKQTLLFRAQHVGSELVQQLDNEIDRISNATRDGFRQARKLLDRLIDPLIALQADVLGEDPKNFVSEMRAAQASLDARLGISIDNVRTTTLLKQISQLRSRLIALETTLSLSSAQAVPKAAIAGTTVAMGSASAPFEKESATGMGDAGDRQQHLLAEIEETRSQIDAACAEYVDALNEEEERAAQMRHDAKAPAREAKAKTVESLEAGVTKLGDQLSEAKLNLDELAEERRHFIRRHLVVYPLVFALLLATPGLIALLGLAPALAIVGFVMANPLAFGISLLVAVVVYLVLVLYKFLTGINRLVGEAREKVKGVEQGLRYSGLQLERARSDQLRLEYDLYAQLLRVNTIRSLREAAGERIVELDATMRAFSETCEALEGQFRTAVPYSSITSRTALSAAAIDRYYAKEIDRLDQVARVFLGDVEGEGIDSVSRAAARQMRSETFNEKLRVFAEAQFSNLSKLTIQDVLLKSELLDPAQAVQHLRALNNAAMPLIRLREIDASSDHTANTDLTLWAGSEDHSQLLALYRKINPKADIYSSANSQTLRVLTRNMNFPIYLLSQIQYYRHCYEQSDMKVESLAHPIPEEMLVDKKVRRSYETLLLAIVMEAVNQKTSGHYSFGNQVLQGSRREIAEQFVSDYNSQRTYEAISAEMRKRLDDQSLVHRKIIDFLSSTSELDSYENDLLNELAQKYDPERLI